MNEEPFLSSLLLSRDLDRASWLSARGSRGRRCPVPFTCWYLETQPPGHVRLIPADWELETQPPGHVRLIPPDWELETQPPDHVFRHQEQLLLP